MKAFLILFLLSAGGLGADAQVAPTPFLVDGAGDVSGTSNLEWPAEFMPAVDLRSLDYQVNAEFITFTIGVEGLSTAHTPSKDSTHYRILWRHEGVEYRTELIRQIPISTSPGVPALSAELFRLESNAWTLVHEPQVTANEEAATLTMQLPLEHILDDQGIKPHPGSQLDELLVHSWHQSEHPEHEPGRGDYWTDRMPDDKHAIAILDFEAPVDDTLAFTSHDGRRLSNGGPDVLLFPISVSNTGDQSQVIDFALHEMPAGWTATLLDESIEVQPGAEFNSLVAVQIPSAHAHGSSESVTVQATGRSTTFEATVPLVVEFTTIPQPAGHHNLLHLHTRDRESTVATSAPVVTGSYPTQAYMNTLDVDERATGEPVSPRGLGSGLGGWRIPLDPGLGMGLDFIPGEQAAVEFTVDRSHVTYQPDTEFRVYLAVSNETTERVLSSVESVREVITGETVIRVAPTLMPEADVVAYAPGQNLELVIVREVSNVESGFFSVLLLPGGTVELPLLEYRDEIPLPSSLALDATVSPELHRSPAGGVAVFTVEATNRLQEEATLRLASIMDDAQVAIKPALVSVKGGESASFEVRVPVPETLQANDIHRTLLRLEAGDHRLVLEASVLIDEEAPLIVDAEGPRETPASSALVAVACLLLVGLARQRARENR